MRIAAACLVAFILAGTASADDPGGAPAPPARSARTPLPTGAAVPASALAEKLTCVDGRTITLAEARGKAGTLIVFTCNHCPFVKAWQDRLVAACNAAGEKGIGVVAVNSNDVTVVPGDAMKPMKELADAKGYRFPYGCDSGARLARAFGATRTPEVFLLDAQGRVAYHGAIDDNAENAAGVKEHWLADAVDALANGREIAVKDTKAMGCSIKFPVGS